MYQSSGKVVYPEQNQGTLDLLANKEVDMVPAWADMALTQMETGERFRNPSASVRSTHPLQEIRWFSESHRSDQ